MSRLRMDDIRKYNEKDLRNHIQDTRTELAKLLMSSARGTIRKESGKIKPLRHDIARMLTRLNELRHEEDEKQK